MKINVHEKGAIIGPTKRQSGGMTIDINLGKKTKEVEVTKGNVKKYFSRESVNSDIMVDRGKTPRH